MIVRYSLYDHATPENYDIYMSHEDHICKLETVIYKDDGLDQFFFILFFLKERYKIDFFFCKDM